MSSPVTRRGFLAASAIAPSLAAAPAPQAPPAVRTLGRTGLKVTSVGFGCMITSDPAVVERAVDLGINYFDTARVYRGGQNERMVGAALKAHRKQVIISTKTQSRDKAGALAHLETSLRELQTDYVDIWFLHDRGSAADITDGSLEALAEAKKQGKIRFGGLSTHGGHAEVIPAALKHKEIEVILTTYNFAMPASMEPVIRSIHLAGVGAVAMKVMAGSFRVDPNYDYDRARSAIRKPGGGLAALKWCLRSDFIHTTIPSIRDFEQLDENVRAMKEPYTPADSQLLAARSERIRPLYCRMCGACRGACPQGLPVSDVIRFVSYAEGYGEFQLARENWLTLSEEQRAVRCADCARCTVECPNGVHIRDRLIRAQELFA
jgi:aryl-alcohol dehydrogenase-like predicted oxidoreductase